MRKILFASINHLPIVTIDPMLHENLCSLSLANFSFPPYHFMPEKSANMYLKLLELFSGSQAAFGGYMKAGS
jgi:hypothetical protein